MSRLPNPPVTALGVELRRHRGARSQADAAAEARLPPGTLARIERGTHTPSLETARLLATWLGWTVEEVAAAAEAPVAAPKELMAATMASRSGSASFTAGMRPPAG